jgi:predicted Zn-dependent protease
VTPVAKRRAALLGVVGALVGAAALLARVQGSAPRVSFEVASDTATETMRAVDRAGLAVTRISDDEEVELGRHMDGMLPLQRGSTADTAYVQKIVETLARSGDLRRPGLTYRASIVVSNDVNAFASPGGYVYVTSAMLDFVQSEAELAAVLGHEMAHVDLRHCVERIQYRVAARKVGGAPLEVLAAIGSELWQAGYADDQESDADRRGVLYAARAGYDPRAAGRLFRRMEMLHGGVTPPPPGSVPGELGGAVETAVSNYFRSHPSDAERIARIDRDIAEQGIDVAAGRWYVGKANLAQRVPWSELEVEEEWVTGDSQSEPAGSSDRG